jgi:hypothetical protein
MREMQCTTIHVFSVNPGDSGMSGESGLRFPEFLGFTAKTLNRNATQIHHGKLEILQIQSLWNLFQLFPKEKNGKNMPREVDRVRSSIDTLGREGKTLQIFKGVVDP